MLKKIFIVLGVIVFLIVGAGVAIPYLYKDEIVARVKSEINSQVNARVDFGVFDFTLLRSFPDFTLSVSDLTITGTQEFEGDTLASIGVTYVSLDLMSVFRGGRIDIKRFELEDPTINLIVLEDGKANWDIMKDEDPSTTGDDATSFHVALKRYSITRGILKYDDRSLKFFMSLEGLEHEGKGDFTSDLFTLITKTQAEKTRLVYEGVPYLSGVKSDLAADLEIDLPNMKFTMKQNQWLINDLVLDVSGFVSMPAEDIDMDIKLKSARADFKDFISLIPAIYSKDFDQLTASGTMALSGYVTGKYNDYTTPAFGLALKIDNGAFKYPSLPQELKDVAVDLKIDKPQGEVDLTKIDLAKLHFLMGSNPVDVKMLVTHPVSDPNIDLSARGTINLAEVGKLVPLEPATEMAGTVSADMGMKGRMSAVEAKKFQEFDARGFMTFSNVMYKSAGQPPMSLTRGKLTFNPATIGVSDAAGKFGKSDFNLEGSIDNMLGFVFRNDNLKADFQFTSTVLDFNEFITGDTGKTTATTPQANETGILVIPDNLNISLRSNIGRVLYEDWVIENVKGIMLVAGQAINLRDVSMRTLDGTVTLNGQYSTVNATSPTIEYVVNASELDISKTFKTFEAVKKMAPIAGNTTGRYSAVFEIAGRLDSAMNPVMNSLNGKGVLKTIQITVNNFEPVARLGEKLKIDKFKSLNVRDINISFRFLDGRVYADPFDIKMGDIASQVAGSNGFDETIDYVMAMSIPRSMFGQGANNVLNDLVLKANNSGANFSVGERISVDAIIKGTVKDPQITTSLKDAGKNLMGDLKAKAQAELDQKKQELESKARAEAEKLKQETEDKAKAEFDKAKKEADDKIKAEQERIKAEADRLKKEAEEKAKKEAQDKLKNVFKK